jgi:glutamine amidotransferase
MRSWLFAHSGTIDRFEAIQPRLLETMPDFIRRNVRGRTDSEHFFHVALSFLHDSSQLRRPEANDKAVLSALRSTVRLVDRLSQEVGAEKATLNCVLTNGRSMYAIRRGHPLKYVERSGIHDPADGEIRAERKGAVRYVMLVSDGPEAPHPYVEVPDDSVLLVDRDLSCTVYAL